MSSRIPKYLSTRDSRQLINVQQKQRPKFRLTYDAIYNLHEIAYDMGDFVKVIKTFPDLTIVCGLKEIIREFASIIQVKYQAPQLLSYDTTFQLGDFYLSPLLFRYTKFASSPTIPCLFLIQGKLCDYVASYALEVCFIIASSYSY